MSEFSISAVTNGRPDTAGLTAREVAVYDLLDALGILYRHVAHDAAETMEACAEIDTRLGTKMCKNLFLCNRQQTDFYLLLMPGDKPFKTKELSAQINSARLSFAGEEDMVRLLGLKPGSVSVMGLLFDTGHEVTLLVDNDLKDAEYLGCHPCVNTSSLKVKTADILGRFTQFTGHNVTYVTLVGAE